MAPETKEGKNQFIKKVMFQLFIFKMSQFLIFIIFATNQFFGKKKQ